MKITSAQVVDGLQLFVTCPFNEDVVNVGTIKAVENEKFQLSVYKESKDSSENEFTKPKTKLQVVRYINKYRNDFSPLKY